MELKRAQEDLRASFEQLDQLRDEADDARMRSMVAETPLANESFTETSRHADAMQRHHDHLCARISELETRQDQLLDRMTEA